MLMTLTLSVRLGKLCECSHSQCFSLASLCSRLAFFSESDSAPRALLFYSSQRSVKKKKKKKTAGTRFERPVTSELTSAQCLRASPSPQRERAFTRPLHSTLSAVSDIISFGKCDGKIDESLFFWRLRTRRCYRALWSSRPRCSPVRKPVWMQLHSGT